MLSYIQGLLFAYILLFISVLLHELGHYVACKILGFNVVEFSLFIGKPLFKKGIFTVRSKPIGAFVAYAIDVDNKDRKYLVKRIIVMGAGLSVNALLLIIGILFNIKDMVLINTLLILINTIPMQVFNKNNTDMLNIIKTVKQIQ